MVVWLIHFAAKALILSWWCDLPNSRSVYHLRLFVTWSVGSAVELSLLAWFSVAQSLSLWRFYINWPWTKSTSCLKFLHVVDFCFYSSKSRHIATIDSYSFSFSLFLSYCPYWSQQLRGRVGRADKEAYAYLFYPDKSVLSDQALVRPLAAWTWVMAVYVTVFSTFSF